MRGETKARLFRYLFGAARPAGSGKNAKAPYQSNAEVSEWANSGWGSRFRFGKNAGERRFFDGDKRGICITKFPETGDRGIKIPKI